MWQIVSHDPCLYIPSLLSGSFNPSADCAMSSPFHLYGIRTKLCGPTPPSIPIIYCQISHEFSKTATAACNLPISLNRKRFCNFLQNLPFSPPCPARSMERCPPSQLSVILLKVFDLTLLLHQGNFSSLSAFCICFQTEITSLLLFSALPVCPFQADIPFTVCHVQAFQ